MKFRKEYDSIGSINVPVDKYWGASTQRSKKYFDIGDVLVKPKLIKCIAIIKKAAAVTNYKNKDINSKIYKSIVRASNEVIAGKLDNHFPLKVWQTGSGTQTNMNVNEVISNRAIEILKGKKGTKKPVHPNDHVNKSQSTNDVFPTAMHIAIAMETIEKLLPSLILLNKELKKKVREFNKIVKIGRTHLQDATPLSLGQEFSGYQSQLEECINRIKVSLNEIYYLAQGGTAVGTGINTKKNFAGYGELILPENEPGSSIMPGKVNPTQCEAVTMVCVKVIGNHNGITMAGSHGHFELNVFKPLIIHNVLQSIQILSDSTKSFAKYCISGLKADKNRIKHLVDNSLMLVTALSPKIGYDSAAKIAKNALKNKTTLKTEALKSGLINEREYNKIVDPNKMIKPA